MNLYRAEVLLWKETQVSWACRAVLGPSIADRWSRNKEP